MASWQRPVRLLIAVGGGAFGIAVAAMLASRSRAPQPPPASIEQSDPSAVVESAGGQTVRLTGDKEDVRVEFDTLLTYPDNSTRMKGVTVTAVREGGKAYTVRGDLGRVGEGESDISLEGSVSLTVNDGLHVTTDRARYAKQEGVLTAPGPAAFSRGRLSGSGVGLRYDEKLDVLTLLERAVVTIAPGEGERGLHVTAGTAEYRRPEHVLRFDRKFHAVRESTVMDADQATVLLDDADDQLRTTELRGQSRITDVPGRAGGVELMAARDIDLTYAPDGEALERARLVDRAAVQVSGGPGLASRRIAASAVEITLANGSTPTALAARGGVELQIPPDGKGPERLIQADRLEATGDAEKGLQSARFTGDTMFRERTAGARDRTARASVLQAALTPGLGSIEEARFASHVRFEDGDIKADAAAARYRLTEGTLELGGTEPGRDRPHLSHERVDVHATAMTVTLEGPLVDATGEVKSVLQPNRAADTGDRVVVPSMLKADQPVNVTAAELKYNGRDKRAVYTGDAWLWQGDTSVKAGSITIDDRAGDMSAEAKVVTTSVLEQRSSEGRRERVRTTTTSKAFEYKEQGRRATYTGDAHMNGVQGDVTAAKIELYLKPSGDALDKAEAYEGVTLREKARKTVGARMSYFGDDDRYLMTGAPVTIVDECGRETTGQTLTFFRTTDRVVVDGSNVIRTQSKGVASCPDAR